MEQGIKKRSIAGIVTMLAVAGCGADSVGSPGSPSVVINNPPAPAPTPAPTPTAPVLATPAADCPVNSDLTNSGIISGPTGTYRVCTLPARITRSITLPKVSGLLYQMASRVDVGADGGPTASAADTNVTLTIAPGVILFAGSGQAWLAVNRGNKINAVGTATQPIVFTSKQNVEGNVGANSSGQWGGVVLLGRAQITDCLAGGAVPGSVGCERQTEGAADPARFGGATNTDSSGQMSFVQLRYSGANLTPDNELQSLTGGGIGSGTVLDHIQSHNSSDDAVEFFGGHVNLKYLVMVGAEDDNLDTDTGVKANFQYVLAIQRAGQGDSIIEADSDNANEPNTPRQNTIVSNATFIANNAASGNRAAMLLRGGTDYTLVNSVVVSPLLPCLRISLPSTIQAANPAQDELGPPVFRSVVMQCASNKYVGSGVSATDVASVFGSGANNNSDAFTPTLTNVFVNGPNETAVPAFNAKTLNAFFDTTNYIGAVRNAADTWYAGWTCNSETANFGTGNSGLCTSLPTL